MSQRNNQNIPPVNDNINARVNVDKVFTPEECQKILDLSKSMPLMKAGVTKSNTVEDVGIDLQLRKSEVRWTAPNPDTQWIFDRIGHVVKELNQHYRFDITGFEALQIARYTKGSFFNWHVDIGPGNPSRRKLSFSVQLSDPADYEGGELIFRAGNQDSFVATSEQGGAIVFPTFLPHQVTTITKGVRWSLVGWIIGPPFR